MRGSQLKSGIGVRYGACADESGAAIRIAKAGSKFCHATLRLEYRLGGGRLSL